VAAKNLQDAISKQEDQRVRTRAGFGAGQSYAAAPAANSGYAAPAMPAPGMPVLQQQRGPVQAQNAAATVMMGPGNWALGGMAAPAQYAPMHAYMGSTRQLPVMGQPAAAPTAVAAPAQGADASAAVAQFIGMIQQLCAGVQSSGGQGGHTDPEAKMAKALDELRLAPLGYRQGAGRQVPVPAPGSISAGGRLLSAPAVVGGQGSDRPGAAHSAIWL